MKTKILITGANGFIGSHSCEMLDKENIDYLKFDGDCLKTEDWDKNLNNKNITHVLGFSGFNSVVNIRQIFLVVIQ